VTAPSNLRQIIDTHPPVSVPEFWQHTLIMASRAAASTLRERRQQAGLTQAELAGRAGVSRQLVQAVEAGENTPAVDAALALARALSCTVEELFTSPPSAVVPALGDAIPDRTPLRVGRVGDQLVAAELADHGTAGATWARPDGVSEDGRLRLFGGASPAGLVIAGCDPALGIAETALQGSGSSSLLALSASTGAAIRALGRGSLHGAVVHGPARRLPAPPLPVIRMHLARWHVGLATPGELQDRSLEFICHSDLFVAQRDPAAASQQAFDRALARAGLSRPGGPTVSGHIDAARTAAIRRCAAITTEGAAQAFGLAFQPLEEHSVQIWLDERWAAHRGIGALGDVLTSRAFRERVAQFGGYDLTDCGSPVAAATA
jgi:transcriptional regulator with XRE-family HTH domain